MINNLYSIYDKVSGVFNKPFVEVNDASAKRAFQHSLKSAPDMTDYELYYIGQFDDGKGDLMLMDKDMPRKIWTGLAIASQSERVPEMLKVQNPVNKDEN